MTSTKIPNAFAASGSPTHVKGDGLAGRGVVPDPPQCVDNQIGIYSAYSARHLDSCDIRRVRLWCGYLRVLMMIDLFISYCSSMMLRWLICFCIVLLGRGGTLIYIFCNLKVLTMLPSTKAFSWEQNPLEATAKPQGFLSRSLTEKQGES